MQYPILTFTLFSALLFIPLIFSKSFRQIITSNCISLIVIGVVAHIMAATMPYLHGDIYTLRLWPGMLVSEGFANFYDPAAPALTTYPPVYLYMSYIIGIIQQIFDLSLDSPAFIFIIKMPPMIFDILTGLLIYKVAYKKVSPTFAWYLSLAYMVCPAILIDSAIWGQVDSIYTFFVLFSLYFMMEKKYLAGYMFYVVAILTKPQALIFGPIYVYMIFRILAENRFRLKGFIQVCICGFSSLFLMALLMWPFARESGFLAVFQQYKTTMVLFPRASLGASNIYTLLGANQKGIEEVFYFITYQNIGRIAIVVITLLSFLILFLKRKNPNYYLVAGFLNSMVFMFVTQMHERYLFPSVALFFMALVYKYNKRMIFLTLGYSIILFFNCYDVLIGGDHIQSMAYLNLLLTFVLLQVVFQREPKVKAVENVVENPEGMVMENILENPEGMAVENIVENPEGMAVENIVEIPEGMTIENIVENPEGMVIENIVENPEGMAVENIVEIPEGIAIENIVEIPEGMVIENIVEIPEGMTIENIVENPEGIVMENIVENPEGMAVENIVENPEGMAVENIVENPEGMAVENIVEIPEEMTIENILENPEGMVIENIVENPEGIVMENIVENPEGMAVENIVEIPEEMTMENIVENPEGIVMENILENPEGIAVENILENPEGMAVESPVEIPEEMTMENTLENPEGMAVESPFEIPEEMTIENIVENPEGMAVESPVEIPEEMTIENIVENPEWKTIESLVENPEGMALENIVEIPEEIAPEEIAVENIVEIPEAMAIENIVENPEEIAIENTVEIPEAMAVENIVEIPEGMAIENIVENPEAIAIENIVEIPEAIAIENIVEIPEAIAVENIVEIPEAIAIENIVEIPEAMAVENIVEIPEAIAIENIVEIPEAIAIENIVEIPEAIAIENTVEIPEAIAIENTVEIPEAIAIENIVEIPEAIAIENTVEIPEGMAVENIVEIPEAMAIENIIEIPEGMAVENIVEIPEGMPKENSEEIPEEIPKENVATIVPRRISKIFVVFLALLYICGYFYPNHLLLKKSTYTREGEAVNFLKENGLENGLTAAQFPNYITKVLGESFNLTPIITKDGKVAPKSLTTSSSDYEEEFDFVVFTKNSRKRVRMKTIANTFGYPEKTYEKGNITILAYPEGIDINNPVPYGAEKDKEFVFDESIGMMLGSGWSASEGGKRWTVEDHAYLDVIVDDFNEDIVFHLKYDRIFEDQVLGDIYVNGTKVKVEDDKIDRELKIHIPNDIYENELHIEFNLPNCISPQSIGQSGDGRTLGIYATSFVITSEGVDITTPVSYVVKKDEQIIFDDNITMMLGSGWGENEAGKRWTVEEKAYMKVSVVDFNEDIIFHLKYDRIYNDQVLGDIYVNGTKVKVEDDKINRELKIYIPNDIYSNELKIEFNLPNCLSPQSIGQGNDVRTLGIYALSFVITSAK